MWNSDAILSVNIQVSLDIPLHPMSIIISRDSKFAWLIKLN